MPPRASLTELQSRQIIRPDHPILGALVQGYDPDELGRTSSTLVYWHCSCGVDAHFTRMQPDSVQQAIRKHRDPFHCERCHGVLPSRSIAPSTSAGELRVRSLVEVGNELYAVHVMPWKGCNVPVDAFFPFKKIVVCHDGRSHDQPMPADRGGKRQQKDSTLEERALKEGFKLVRLHWKDEEEWGFLINKALAEWQDPTPLRTTHARPK